LFGSIKDYNNIYTSKIIWFFLSFPKIYWKNNFDCLILKGMLEVIKWSPIPVFDMENEPQGRINITKLVDLLKLQMSKSV